MKKRHSDGVAMIVVMCVMVLVLALSLVLLLTSSVLITNAQRTNRKEQCRVTAVAVAKLLEEEVEAIPPIKGFLGEEENIDSELGKILKTVGLESTWPSYSDKDAEKRKNVVRYELAGDALPGTTVVELYWKYGDGTKDLDLGDDVAKAADLYQEIKLYIRVTNTVGEESSTIISTFEPLVSPDWMSRKWRYYGHGWEGSDS